MLKAVIPPTLKLFPLLLIDKCPYPRKPRFSYLRVPCVIVNVYYKAGRFLGVQWEWISQQTATPYSNLLMLLGFLKFLNMIWCFKKCHPIYLLYSLLFTCGSYYPIMPWLRWMIQLLLPQLQLQHSVRHWGQLFRHVRKKNGRWFQAQEEQYSHMYCICTHI